MATDATLHGLLKQMVEMGASDLHLTTQSPPMVRLDGKLIPLPYPALTVPETKQLAYSVLTDAQKHRFEENLELDFSFGVKSLARFRANNFMQRGAVGGVYLRFRTRSWDSRSWACRRSSSSSATSRAGSSSSAGRRARARRPRRPR